MEIAILFYNSDFFSQNCEINSGGLQEISQLQEKNKYELWELWQACFHQRLQKETFSLDFSELWDKFRIGTRKLTIARKTFMRILRI